MTTYGKRIRDLRLEKGRTQEYMAEQLGISQNAYSKIEIDKTRIKAEVLEKIADVLEVEKHRLLSEPSPLYKIKQTNNDQAVGIAIHQENFEKERKTWQALEISLRETIAVQKELIEQIRKT